MLQKLEGGRHQILYWVGYEDSEAHRFPNTIFHSYRDAVWAIPPKGIDSLEFPPPGADIISKLYADESIILTMLNAFMPDKDVSERKRLYYRLLSYWLGTLKKYQPEAIIFGYVPHYVYDYLIYALARLLGIKTLMFLDTTIPRRTLLLDDIFGGSELLKRAMKINSEKNFSLDDLNGDLKNYYQKNSNVGYTLLPSHIQYQKKKFSFIYKIFNLIKRGDFFKPSIFKRAYSYLDRSWRKASWELFRKKIARISWQFRDNLKKEYNRVQSKADFTNKFVYVPLQVQPECTTCPQGGRFSEQILMLEILSAALPAGWLIYAKEHPIQWLRYGVGFSPDKYRGFYEQMAKIKNVKLMPVEINSYDLLNSSQAVATITGTVGWEAILRSKPTVIFGYPWYKDCPVLFRVNDTESCRQALAKIKNGFKVDQQKIIDYLKIFDEATVRCYMSPSVGEGTGLTKSESMANIAQAILKELT